MGTNTHKKITQKPGAHPNFRKNRKSASGSAPQARDPEALFRHFPRHPVWGRHFPKHSFRHFSWLGLWHFFRWSALSRNSQFHSRNTKFHSRNGSPRLEQYENQNARSNSRSDSRNWWEPTWKIFICPNVLGGFFRELGWSPRNRITELIPKQFRSVSGLRALCYRPFPEGNLRTYRQTGPGPNLCNEQILM